MLNDEQMLKKRFEELSARAEEHCCYTYTDFLNMDEQSTLSTLHLSPKLYGGYENAERVIARFGNGGRHKDESYPITIIKITPVSKKFADELTHRDFLGTLMGLGIRREMLGDILIQENCGYVFCADSISGYITEQLDRVRHTTVKSEIVSFLPESAGPELQKIEIIVSSERLDVLVSAVYKLSRNDAQKLIAQQKVFINSRLTESTAKPLTVDDTVSVRGFGRFIYGGHLRTTKKDRLVVSVSVL